MPSNARLTTVYCFTVNAVQAKKATDPEQVRENLSLARKYLVVAVTVGILLQLTWFILQYTEVLPPDAAKIFRVKPVFG